MTTKRRPVTARTVSAPARTGDTVTIACKLPSGLKLRVFQEQDGTEATPTGKRRIKIWAPIPGREFVVNGWGELPHISPQDRFYDRIVADHPGGYTLTPGCPRDLWEQFAEQNAGTWIMTSGVIFAVPTDADAALEARSRESILSGMEPVDGAHPEKSMPPSLVAHPRAGSHSQILPNVITDN